MNLPLMQSLVDQALADASRQILSDPSGSYVCEDQAGKLARAAQELKNALGAPGPITPKPDPRMPNYEDPWVALAYTHWYQLRQIHLAYSLTKDLLDDETIRRAPGHEIRDVGCGALAFAIGLALAVAECLEVGDSVGQFEFHGYDCESFQTIGWNHWTALRQVAGSQPQAACLARAMDLIRVDLRSVVEGSVDQLFADCTKVACRWLVAQHIAYEVNQDEVQADLAEWFKSIQPHIGLVTGPAFKNRVTDHINPFGMLRSCQQVRVTPRLNGAAPAITNHRVEIAGDHRVPSSYLLRQNVSWGQISGGGTPYALRYLQLPQW